MKKFSHFNRWSLIIGYLFLYVPLLMVVIFSFNASRMVGSWSGFSWRWYQALQENEGLFSAVMTSLKIASLSATIAVILGTMASVLMCRFGRFKGRTLFSGMISAPLIMPDVITGLALLMMFVSAEQMFGFSTHRGVLTITIAHITLAMAYVFLVVQARLKTFDMSLEEAAQDLGAKPAKVFMVITLPLIFPSLVSGWLLSFALSLDDVVIASFVSGPGATTLPMLIFSSIRLGTSPEINALATVIMVAVSLVVVLAHVLTTRIWRLR